MSESSEDKVVQIPLADIEVGERRREDYGDIAGLASGIQRVGQLSPILVCGNGNGDYRLVYGGRRLKAITSLGWSTIRAVIREQLTEEELRDIELEENENRKDLTERERARRFESSKKLIKQAKTAAEAIASEIRNSKPGPKTSGGSRREAAEALGIAEGTLRKAEQHVETAERFPFMQGNQWRQSHVLAVREELEKVPEPEQDKVMGVLGCAKVIDPATAVKLVKNISQKPVAERKEIYDLSVSKRPVDQSLALTRAAELPPMPDPRIGLITRALDVLKSALQAVPDDEWNPRITGIMADLKTVRTGIRKVVPSGSTLQ